MSEADYSWIGPHWLVRHIHAHTATSSTISSTLVEKLTITR